MTLATNSTRRVSLMPREKNRSARASAEREDVEIGRKPDSKHLIDTFVDPFLDGNGADSVKVLTLEWH